MPQLVCQNHCCWNHRPPPCLQTFVGRCNRVLELTHSDRFVPAVLSLLAAVSMRRCVTSDAALSPVHQAEKVLDGRGSARSRSTAFGGLTCRVHSDIGRRAGTALAGGVSGFVRSEATFFLLGSRSGVTVGVSRISSRIWCQRWRGRAEARRRRVEYGRRAIAIPSSTAGGHPSW